MTTLWLYYLTNPWPIGSTSSASPNSYTRPGTDEPWVDGQLGTSEQPGAYTGNVATTVGGPADVQFNNYGPVSEWLSQPLDTSVTISGSMTFNMYGMESSMSANSSFRVIVDSIDPAGNIGSTIINSANGTELGTSNAVRNWSGTPTSTTLYRGDRIRVRVYATDAGGTMGSGYTITMRYNGSAAVSGDAYVSFTETLAFDTYLESGNTQYWARADGVLSTTPSGATSVTSTVAGYTSPIQVTASAGGSALEWLTPELGASTIDQVYFNSGSNLYSSGSGYPVLVYELALCDSSGGSASLIAVHRMGHYTSSTPSERSATTAFPTVSISSGQRIRLRVYIDDGVRDPMTAGRTITLDYGASGGLSIYLPTLSIGGGGTTEDFMPFTGGGYYPS